MNESTSAAASALFASSASMTFSKVRRTTRSPCCTVCDLSLSSGMRALSEEHKRFRHTSGSLRYCLAGLRSADQPEYGREEAADDACRDIPIGGRREGGCAPCQIDCVKDDGGNDQAQRDDDQAWGERMTRSLALLSIARISFLPCCWRGHRWARLPSNKKLPMEPRRLNRNARHTCWSRNR